MTNDSTPAGLGRSGTSRSGPTDSIVDVAGVWVGHSTDTRRPTGCSVVLTPRGAVGGVDVRGAAPGTRETDLLSPINAVDRVHGVLLAGGSAFGLDAASGVMRWLEERQIGYPVGPVRVPIVPAAILFDLFTGDPSIRPDAASGYAACDAAGRERPAEGNVGAGAGALVGKLFGIERAMKGGIGTASVTLRGITVGAIVAVNAIGDVIDPSTGRVVAGARDISGRERVDTVRALLAGDLPPNFVTSAAAGTATTIGVVATDAILTKPEAGKLAQMSHDGLARTIHPVHTMSDGDVLFALGTGTSGLRTHLTLLGVMAAEAVARAVLRAVRAARGIVVPDGPVFPSAWDFDHAGAGE